MSRFSLRVRLLLPSLVLVFLSNGSLFAEGLSTEGDVAPSHPLAATIQFAEARQSFIRENVRTYSCQLIKRERIGGRLQAYQYADVQVHCGNQGSGESASPMSVLMRFQDPAKLKGRLVLFTEGENDGQACVRMGGTGLFKNVELKVDPHGEAARRESRYPITDIGFDRIMQRLIDLAQDDLRADPKALNTVVTYFQNAKLKDRSCTHIQVVHPQHREGFSFHKASLYVDDELKVPVRLVVFDWPEEKGGKPRLIEEYNYMNLKLNVDLEKNLFQRSRYFNDE